MADISKLGHNCIISSSLGSMSRNQTKEKFSENFESFFLFLWSVHMGFIIQQELDCRLTAPHCFVTVKMPERKEVNADFLEFERLLILAK